jgi:hypothetical protein
MEFYFIFLNSYLTLYLTTLESGLNGNLPLVKMSSVREQDERIIKENTSNDKHVFKIRKRSKHRKTTV